ncbi:MAG: apolipoprotein N-acyltransferase [Rubritalea sp.]|uniref:apolipoprotein N-acyltransferase n=1 Tax=Rubritalea sp. TaxID=2109375 RepID=UPI003242F791
MSTFQRLMPYLAAALSGVLLAMCYPGFEFASGLVWIWPVPLMIGLWLGGAEKKRKRFGFRVGALAGLVFWLINVKWLIAMGDLPTVPQVGAICGWLMLSLYLAIYFGVWGALASSFGNPWRSVKARKLTAIGKKIAQRDEAPKKRVNGLRNSLRVVIFAVMHASLWVVLEWLRGWLMTGFGWNGLGVAFHEVPVMMQIADIVGVTGIAFFPMLFASAMLQTGRRLVDELRAGKFQAHFEVGIVIGTIAFVFAYGVNRMAYYSNQPSHDVRVLLIQENIPQTIKWDEILEAEHYIEYQESIEREMAAIDQHNKARMIRAAKTGEEVEIEYPDLLVLPESATTQPLVYIDLADGIYMPLLTHDLLVNQIYEEHHFKTVFGANLLSGTMTDEGVYYNLEGNAYNVFAVTDPSITAEESFPTKQIQTHGKNHLVPFGEFIPDIPFLGSVAELFSGMSYGKNFSRGESFEPLNVELRGENVQLIPSICFEDTVGRLNRKFARPELQMSVNITNDGWFGTSEAALQHMANAKFRAVEIRRPMARAANTGVSGVVDVIGTMESDLEGKLNVIGSLEDPFVKGGLYTKVKVPENTTMTVYAMLGDWFTLLCLLLCVAAAIFCLKCQKEV